jgi:hypothetical protein
MIWFILLVVFLFFVTGSLGRAFGVIWYMFGLGLSLLLFYLAYDAYQAALGAPLAQDYPIKLQAFVDTFSREALMKNAEGSLITGIVTMVATVLVPRLTKKDI